MQWSSVEVSLTLSRDGRSHQFRKLKSRRFRRSVGRLVEWRTRRLQARRSQETIWQLSRCDFVSLNSRCSVSNKLNQATGMANTGLMPFLGECCAICQVPFGGQATAWECGHKLHNDGIIKLRRNNVRRGFVPHLSPSLTELCSVARRLESDQFAIYLRLGEAYNVVAVVRMLPLGSGEEALPCCREVHSFHVCSAASPRGLLPKAVAMQLTHDWLKACASHARC